MAETAKKTSDAAAKEVVKHTQYRVFKLTGEGEITLPNGETQAVELFALLPSTFEGNVFKKAHAAFGDGDYVKTADSSYDRKPVATTTVVKVG